MFKMLKNNKGFWAAAAPFLASTAGGLLQGAMGGGEDGSQGYDLPMMTAGPWDIDNQMMSSKMAQDSARNAMIGRLPPGMEALLARMKSEQLRQSKEQMYGRAGDRGGSIMNNTMSMGSQGGVGPKAMMAQGSKAMQDYAGRTAQIQNYIDSLKFTGLQKGTADAYSMMQQMPRSAEIPWSGQAIPMNQGAQPGMDLGLQNIDYQKLFSGMTQPTQSTQTSRSPLPQMSVPQYGGQITGAATPGWLAGGLTSGANAGIRS